MMEGSQYHKKRNREERKGEKGRGQKYTEEKNSF
jgi:hypothetical protein